VRPKEADSTESVDIRKKYNETCASNVSLSPTAFIAAIKAGIKILGALNWRRGLQTGSFSLNSIPTKRNWAGCGAMLEEYTFGLADKRSRQATLQIAGRFCNVADRLIFVLCTTFLADKSSTSALSALPLLMVPRLTPVSARVESRINSRSTTDEKGTVSEAAPREVEGVRSSTAQFLTVSSDNAHSGPQPRSPRLRVHAEIAHWR